MECFLNIITCTTGLNYTGESRQPRRSSGGKAEVHHGSLSGKSEAISSIKREAKTRLQRKPAAGKVHIFPKVGFKVLSESLWLEK